MNYEAVRADMIAQQIRPWRVRSDEILNALQLVKREAFIPAEYKALAFADMQIPLGDGEVILEPKVGARMVEELHLAISEVALNIGAGSSYLAAVMAKVCKSVVAVEINPRIAKIAEQNLINAEISNVDFQQDDANNGWGEANQFDAILIGGALPKTH